MKQVKIDDILWVMQPEPYIITDDTDSSQIMVNCNSYKEFCTLNPSLNLTAWNYKLIRKWNPVYYEYWDDKEHSDFYFAETTQNISSYLDEDKTVTLQQLVLPEDIDVSAIYKLGDEVISGNTFVLENAGQYVVTGIITDSSIYEDYEGSYIINYSKIKRTATLSFTNSTVDVSTFVDANYSGTIQTANNIPSGVEVKYYLDSSLLSSNNITISTAGNHTVTAKIENDSLYNNTECSYTIAYTKVKRDAVLSFDNATVDVSTWIDENYSGTIQAVQNAPANVTIHYYLDNVELQGNSITLTSAGQHIIKAAIVSDEVYNDTFATYTINYVKNKRNAVLSFANAVIEETVEDVTTFSGQVQNVVGLPTGVTANYYLGNTLLNNGVISIDNLQEGENTFTITAKLENDPVYNNAQASYNLVVTMEISSYENKYLTFEALEDGTFKFADKAVSYSVDNGKTWTSLPANTSTGTIHQGEKILWKGTNNNYGNSRGQIKSSGRFNVEGNIMSLIYGDDFIGKISLQNQRQVFLGFFLNGKYETYNKIVNAENLVLPATTLTQNCYGNMFEECHSLITAPIILPATTLASSCYNQMFVYCNSLTTTPELPATTLISGCYSQMFQNCGNIKFIKAACPPYSEDNKYNWVYNIGWNGTYVISDPNYNINDGVIISRSCIPPYDWTIKDYQGNVIHPKRIVTISFANSVVNVSTYVDQDYTGTIQSLSNVPSGVTPKYYLDSSLLSSNNITLTTTGNHTVVGAIENDPVYNDTSTSYTINYTREKKDATLRVNFSPASGTQTCSVGDQLSKPTITTNNWPASVNPMISYSTDGENYSNSLPQYVDTSTAGTHAIYVKQEIRNNDFTYKPQTQIFTWEYTVEEPVFGGLTVKYNISDGEVGQEIALFYGGGGSSSGSSESGSSDSTAAGGTLPTSMIVDGVEETPINTWRFLTAGEHIVQYTFADNIIPANYFFNRDFTSIIIGDDIVTVYGNAFTSCLNLTSVTIEKTPTIAALGFYSCENLLSITCKSTNPCFLGQQVFENTNNCPIYVPAESVESYKGGPGYWSDYASRIYPISE